MNKFWNDVIQGFASAQPGFTPVTSYYTSASQTASAPAVAQTAATQQTTSNTPNRSQGATAEDVYRATHLAEEQVKRSNTYPKYLIDPSKPYGYKPFKRSREGSSIQRFLNSQGYNLEVDGKVGKATMAAIKDWQRKHGLIADGLWGDNTEKMARSYEQQMFKESAPKQQITALQTTPTVTPPTQLEVPQMVTVPNHLSTLGQFTPVFRNDYYASLSPEDSVAVEAAQYQKRGGCMYKRGKRVK